MQSFYLLMFCKLVVGSSFAISLLFKLINFSRHVDTVRGFQLLPKAFEWTAAVLILGLESLIILLLFQSQLAAFSLASVLFIVFSIALASTLFRGMKVSCNCFGNSQHAISQIDLFRNFGFLLCAGSGCWLTITTEANLPISPWLMGITSLIALAFVAIWTQIGEIYRFTQSSFHPNSRSLLHDARSMPHS